MATRRALVLLCLYLCVVAAKVDDDPSERKIKSDRDTESEWEKANWLDEEDRTCESYHECCAGAACRKSIIPSSDKPKPKKCILPDQRFCALCPYGFHYASGFCAPDIRYCPAQAAHSVAEALSKPIPAELQQDAAFMKRTFKNPCPEGTLCVHDPHPCINSAIIDRGCKQFKCVTPEVMSVRVRFGEGDVCKQDERFDPVAARCVPSKAFAVDERPCANCVHCSQGTPTCDRPCKHGEQCVVLPQSCAKCAAAVCVSPADLEKSHRGNLWPKGHNADADEFDVDGMIKELVFPFKPKKDADNQTQSESESVEPLLMPKGLRETTKEFHRRIDRKRPFPRQKCVSCSTLPAPSCAETACPADKECVTIERSCKHCPAVRCVPKNGKKAPDC